MADDAEAPLELPLCFLHCLDYRIYAAYKCQAVGQKSPWEASTESTPSEGS
jgi:hypothetical protein